MLDVSMEKPCMYIKKRVHLCGNTGYTGRIGVYEILPIDQSLRQIINQRERQMIFEIRHLHKD